MKLVVLFVLVGLSSGGKVYHREKRSATETEGNPERDAAEGEDI